MPRYLVTTALTVYTKYAVYAPDEKSARALVEGREGGDLSSWDDGDNDDEAVIAVQESRS